MIEGVLTSNTTDLVSVQARGRNSDIVLFELDQCSFCITFKLDGGREQ